MALAWSRVTHGLLQSSFGGGRRNVSSRTWENTSIPIGEVAFGRAGGEEIGLRVETLQTFRRAKIVRLVGILDRLSFILRHLFATDRVGDHFDLLLTSARRG